MQKLYFLIFTATLVGQAHAAQELLPEQELSTQEAPLMLQIKDTLFSTFKTNGAKYRTVLLDTKLPPKFTFGPGQSLMYKKQRDNTYLLFSYSNEVGKWFLAEETIYRYGNVLDEKGRVVTSVFISEEMGYVTPAPDWFGRKAYFVDLLPDIHFDRYYNCRCERTADQSRPDILHKSKNEKQADGTYQSSYWDYENKQWVLDNSSVGICRRICDEDGYLINTQFELQTLEPESKEEREEEEYENQD